MIISLSQEVCQQVDEIDRLKRLRSSLNDMQDTYNTLMQLKDVTTQLNVLVRLLSERLPEQNVLNVWSTMERLARDVEASAEKLESQPRQVKELTQLQRKAQELMNNLKAQWKLYAKECTREALELLSLVGHLPEVEAQRATYELLTSRLQHYTEHTPLTPDQLNEFDESLQQLNQHLSNIQGLSPDVKNFLRNVLVGRATLADLTNEVLQWCRQGEHARAFAIGFTRFERG